MVRLFQHHVKYQELHGVDEIKLITMSEHKLLHQRLRKEGKCNVPSWKLNLISQKAFARTEHRRNYKRDYNRVNRDCFWFTELFDTNIKLIETIQVYKNGTVCVNSFFRYTGKGKIPVVEVN